MLTIYDIKNFRGKKMKRGKFWNVMIDFKTIFLVWKHLQLKLMYAWDRILYLNFWRHGEFNSTLNISIKVLLHFRTSNLLQRSCTHTEHNSSVIRINYTGLQPKKLHKIYWQFLMRFYSLKSGKIFLKNQSRQVVLWNLCF